MVSLALLGAEIWGFLSLPQHKFAEFPLFVHSLRGRSGDSRLGL